MQIEVIVPIRPGDVDKYPVEADNVVSRIIECPDGNLSKLYRKAYLSSKADIVLFKHDDFGFFSWESFERQLLALIEDYLIIGVAGARSYSPLRNPAWWLQNSNRQGHVDGNNRGIVSHPTHNNVPGFNYLPTLFGPPGTAVILDGCCFAVVRSEALLSNDRLLSFDPYTAEDVASYWDEEFTFHFYDVAFTFNAAQAFKRLGCPSRAAYIVLADVFHDGLGDLDPHWHSASKRFVDKYRHLPPLTT